MTDFSGKNVLITGAARGLGKETALAFAKRGASLSLVDIEEERLLETCNEILAMGIEVEAITADIGSRSACFGAVDQAISRFGQLDVLCNVAATLRFHHVTDVTEDDWERVLSVNLSAPFYFSQAAIPHLLKSHGNIINVTSQASLIGTAYLSAYSTSKGGLLQMTKTMAMEYMKSPIRINAVSPGTMTTEIGTNVDMPDNLDPELMSSYQGLRPSGDPVDVAEVIAFVASDAAKAIHGACVPVDQGVTTG